MPAIRLVSVIHGTAGIGRPVQTMCKSGAVSDPNREWSAPQRDWNAPGSGPRPGQYGEMAPTPPPPQPGPQTYLPPPKPGLIPLHPLTFGRLLGASFQVIRWSPGPAVGWAAIIAAVQVLVTYGGVGLVGVPGLARITGASDSDRGAIIAGTVAEAVLVGIVAIAVSLAGTALLQGIIVTIVTRGALGEKPTFGQVSRIALRSFWRLVLYSLVLGVVQAAVIAVLAVVVTLLVVLGGTVGIVFGVVLGVVGLLALMVAFVWIWVQFGFVPSVIVAEHRGVRAAVARGWRLVKGGFWRTFGLVALVLVICSAAAQVISLPFSLLGSIIVAIVFPNGTNPDDPSTYLLGLLLATVPALIVSVLVGGITSVAQASAFSLAYLDMRMRREGLDIELRAVVESGEVSSADPFVPAD